MKKTSLLVPILALSACLASGALFGCSSDSSSGQDAANNPDLTPLEKILESNTVEKLAGENGTLGCTMEIYDEDSTLTNTTYFEWQTTDGNPSLKYKDEMDGETLIAETHNSDDNCGAVYTLDAEDEYVSIYGQNDFKEVVSDSWTDLFTYEGASSDVTVENNVAKLELTQELEGGEDSYYKVLYSFDPTTYVLSSVEIIDYVIESEDATEENGNGASESSNGDESTQVHTPSDNDAVYERTIIKDINTNASLDLGGSPYQTIGEAAEDASCNLTVVVNQLNGEKYTSNYKVTRTSLVELDIAEDFEMYSDEAMANVIEEIDVNQASATVYVQVKEDSADSTDTLELDNDEVGSEFVSEDGTVLTLGEDGNLYDEEGNMVPLDDIAGSTVSDDSGDSDGESSGQ